MMKLGALLLVCCAGAVQGRRRAARDGAENEVMDKGDVVVKFPAFSYEVPEETLRKNVLRRKLRGRTITTSVEPMEGTWRGALQRCTKMQTCKFA